jgi:hypothetical protein
MATATLSPAPKLQFFDAAGNPLVGGKLYSYAAGTTTPLATYTGNTTTTANPNPVVLDSRGEAGIWLSSSYYKLKLTDSNDVEIWTVDNVGGFATMADLTAAINALTASLAASSGSSLVGFIQAGASAVATTVQAKLRETISVKDFGAVGNDATDDTVSIQAAINYANTIGGDVYFPPGVYRTTNTLVINNAGDIDDRVKASMYGDSSASVRIHADAGSYDMLQIIGGTPGLGTHSHQVIRGLFFQKEGAPLGACIAGDNLAFLSIEDVSVLGGNYAFYATDVLSSVFYNCVFRFANIAMRAEYNNFSYPNAITLVGCVIGNNNDIGVYITGGTNFNMFGGSVESNGLTGFAAVKYGVLLNNSGVQGSVSGNFSGVYFENNVGVADIWLANSAEPAAASISGCSFARLNLTQFVTNNILVETSGAGVKQTVSVAGCGFRFFNSYVPNSGRKYINAISTGSGVSTVAWSGCLFQSSIEAPTIPNEIQLTGSYVFPGWNAVTFQNSWADAGFPSPLCSYYKDDYGIVRLQGGAIRATNSSATIFNLPVGYRPTATLLIGSYGEITSVPSAVVFEIEATGNVKMNTTVSGNKVTFNSVSFSIN